MQDAINIDGIEGSEEETYRQFEENLREVISMCEANGFDPEKGAKEYTLLFNSLASIVKITTALREYGDFDNSSPAYLQIIMEAILMIFAQNEEEYALRLVTFCMGLCEEIFKNTATPGEQFEFMINEAAKKKYELIIEEEPEQEEDEEE